MGKMIHIAIMKKEWGLLEKILSGEKIIESRWYLNRSSPWGKIKKGEEITIDYNCTEYVLFTPFKCNCSVSDCVGEIKGFCFFTDTQKKKRKGKFAKWYV